MVQTRAHAATELGSSPVQLEVKDLVVRYSTGAGTLTAVDGVSFSLAPGESLGLVGESGCGKSTVAKALLRLLPRTAQVEGEVLLDGVDVLKMSAAELRKVRWTKLAFITQSAMNALDPVYRVGDQIVESILAHRALTRSAALLRAQELFSMVGIETSRLMDYPHQFSGGMRQRAVIAMAMSLNAGLLIADEPTTALDSIMQDQILGKLISLLHEARRSMILVTHDMGVVAESCQTVAVMYAGAIVETGPTERVLARAFHPYTMGLLNAFPTLRGRRRSLVSIPGTLPNLSERPSGCRFRTRCPFSTDTCAAETPPWLEVSDGHFVACHYPEKASEFRAAALNPDLWQQRVKVS